jgi:hypothetical protein
MGGGGAVMSVRSVQHLPPAQGVTGTRLVDDDPDGVDVMTYAPGRAGYTLRVTTSSRRPRDLYSLLCSCRADVEQSPERSARESARTGKVAGTPSGLR